MLSSRHVSPTAEAPSPNLSSFFLLHELLSGLSHPQVGATAASEHVSPHPHHGSHPDPRLSYSAHVPNNSPPPRLNHADRLNPLDPRPRGFRQEHGSGVCLTYGILYRTVLLVRMSVPPAKSNRSSGLSLALLGPRTWASCLCVGVVGSKGGPSIECAADGAWNGGGGW